MPASTQRLLVVVPALNEQATIASVVRDVRAQLPSAQCIIVDDGSDDATARHARAAGADVLRLPFNLGVGGAMRTGFRYAREHGYDIVVQVDADGQHDARYIPVLVERLRDADIVIGARFAGVEDYGIRGPRRWAQWVLAHAVSRVAGTALTDVTSGFKAVGPRAIALFAHTYPAEYLGDTVEALVIAARSGMRVTQVPVRMHARQGGAPSHRPGRAIIYLLRAGLAFLLALLRPRVVLDGERT